MQNTKGKRDDLVARTFMEFPARGRKKPDFSPEKDIRTTKILFVAISRFSLEKFTEVIAFHGAPRQCDNGTARGCCECPLIP